MPLVKQVNTKERIHAALYKEDHIYCKELAKEYNMPLIKILHEIIKLYREENSK